MSDCSRKVLLLSNCRPGPGGVGELFLSTLAGALAPGSLVSYSTASPRSGGARGWSEWSHHPAYCHPVLLAGRPLASIVTYWANRIRTMEDMAAEVASIARDQHVSLLWAVTDAPHVVDLALQVAGNTGMPIAVLVWDMPQYFMARWRFDPITRALVQRNCERLIRTAGTLAVASDGMREWFRSAYQVDSIPIIHGYPRSDWLPVRPFQQDSPVRLAFAGSLYARREWNCLMRTVAQADGRVAGRELLVDFIGHSPRRGVRRTSRVVYHGRKRPDEVPHLLNSATIAYLPYWFSRRRTLAVRTSFPSKMSAYLAAGLPILYHGPERSTPTEFLARYPVGVCCHTLEPTDLLGCLEYLLTDSLFIKGFPEARRAALEEELGEHVMLARFRDFISRGGAAAT